VNQEWTTIIIYKTIGSEDGTNTVWDKDTLIIIRDFEKEVTEIENWSNVCLADTDQSTG